ncbi:hypothetical protein EG68_04430 [Paragonimus skrjabini miyazakii]|uniref:Uncharacterized protein n=1 Tax=Paragonimus skrjabini miyazakii TaxID=59628 RepID=A0A8S9YT08_9TREM|nr:hypothetical protein EG68_04430 [Paragonimus skrjabini miyazakii]
MILSSLRYSYQNVGFSSSDGFLIPKRNGTPLLRFSHLGYQVWSILGKSVAILYGLQCFENAYIPPDENLSATMTNERLGTSTSEERCLSVSSHYPSVWSLCLDLIKYLVVYLRTEVRLSINFDVHLPSSLNHTKPKG